MKKWSTPKAIKSQKVIDKALAKLGDSLGLGKPFFMQLLLVIKMVNGMYVHVVVVIQ